MSQPTIPPRPQRQAGATAVKQNTPQIPPRPNRKLEPSPGRDVTRSPFNEPPTAMSNGKVYGHSNLSASDLPARPPSVSSMPTIGQEGLEYASFDNLPSEAHGASGADAKVQEQTRHADVPMQQPTASVPVTTAKERISTVTRTDSSQAAAAGIGKPRREDDVHITPSDSTNNLRRVTSRDEANSLSRVSSREPRGLRENSSFNRSSSNVASGRPASVYDDEHEHGIPEIGLQVPMYPNAGDVQAPSPGPTSAMFPGGIGFFNDGSSRNHHRKRSSRHEFGPPGSYGLHGHPGQEPGDQFEREWVMKHPQEAAKEGYNVYGGLAPRPSTAMSSAQLNKLVHSNSDLGMGASEGVGTPSQEIGWEASEQYTSRMNSPKPSPAMLGDRKKRPSSGNQPPMESPLRKTSFPLGETAHLRDDAVDSEDDNVIHVDGRRQKIGSKVTGGGEKDNKLDLLSAANGHEHDDGTPILASDELEKRPGSAFLQPAVSPEAERSDWLGDHNYSRRGSGTVDSRPSSRPGSIHGGPLSRFISHEERPGSGLGTPLEEIEEYEPLFPEDDDPKSTPTKNFKKRPGLAQHHFPSQDIWEDTPASLQFTTSVETPEPAENAAERKESPPPAAVFETPEQEQARRYAGGSMLSDKKTFAKPHFRSAAHGEAERPGTQRFPSHDIWEDTPDSMRLETTVSGPQEPEVLSPDDERPTTTALASSQDDNDARATTGMSQLMKPQMPSRPIRGSKLSQDITPEIAPVEDSCEKEVPDLGALKETSPTKAKAPSIPDRPKPSIPARPVRSPKPDDSQTISPEQAPAPKPKPAVPARPVNSKFANLKSGFMSDLASRIQLGPTGPPPKPKEPEAELSEEPKAPLVDARKSRAKGPPRRSKAAASSAVEPLKANALTFAFSTPVTIWHIDAADVLHVPGPGVPEAAQAVHPDDDKLAEAEQALAANADANAAEAAPASDAQRGSVSESELARQGRDDTAESSGEGLVGKGLNALAGAAKALAGNGSTTAEEEEQAAPAAQEESTSSSKREPSPQTTTTEPTEPVESVEANASEQLLPPSTTKFAQVGSEGDEPAESISAPVQKQSQEIHSTFEAALSSAEALPNSAGETQARTQAADVRETAQLNAEPGELKGEYTGAKDPGSEGNVVIREGEEVGRQQAD